MHSGSSDPTSTTSFADFYQATREVLESAHKNFDVRMNKGRFGRYLEALQAAAHLPGSFHVDLHRERERWWLLSEALGQCRPLVRSAPTWAGLDRAALQAVLRRIRDGEPMPPAGVEHDDPRNTLLELEVVSCLYDNGFDVEITRNGVDVIGRRPGVAAFAVECKRPSTLNNFEKNVRGARDQVRGRAVDGSTHRMCAIGIDRLVGLGVPEPPSFRNATSFYQQLHRVTLDLRDRLEWLVAEGGFFPDVPVVALSLCAAVYSFEDGCILTPRLFAPAVMLPENDSRGAHLRHVFDRLGFGTRG